MASFSPKPDDLGRLAVAAAARTFPICVLDREIEHKAMLEAAKPIDLHAAASRRATLAKRSC